MKGAHWAGEALAGRASLSVGVGGRTRSGLMLEHLTKEDLGEYRCRVDFLESPTRNARVQLDIIGESPGCSWTSLVSHQGAAGHHW